MPPGNEKLRSLSGKQAQLVLGLLESRVNEVHRALVMERLHVSPGYANKLLHDLETKGWLHRQARGRYRVVPPEWGPTHIPNSHVQAQAVARAPRGYLGLASAAALHGLTTQHRNVVWVMSPYPRRGIHIEDTPVHFVRIKPADMFGIEEKLVLGEMLAVSDVEKTALDCLAYGLGRFDFSELTAMVLKAVRKGQWDTFADYLRRMNNGPLARRLGFLLEVANVQMPSEVTRALSNLQIPKSAIKLDPARTVDASADINEKWRIRVNAPRSELFRV